MCYLLNYFEFSIVGTLQNNGFVLVYLVDCVMVHAVDFISDNMLLGSGLVTMHQLQLIYGDQNGVILQECNCD